MVTPYTAASWFVKSINSIIEQLSPSECLACHQEGPWFCVNCQALSTRIGAPTCGFCNKLSAGGKTCSTCRATYPLTGHQAAWYYRGPITQLVKQSKYQGILAAYTAFDADLLRLFRALPVAVQQSAIVTSVPSRYETVIKRGFNQSEILAQRLARHTGRPYCPLLKRDKTPSPSQTKLNRRQRLTNTQAQFHFAASQACSTPIVIVDDVITTGATLASCAAVLRQHGARTVWGLTIARD